MKNLILFDQDTQHYRQSIYRYFRKEFKKNGYDLIVVYDKKLNNIEKDDLFFIGINYTFTNFIKIIRQYNCEIIIQFVWLRYKFLVPFMIYNRIKGIKTIVWSHGINLQNTNQPIKNIVYYLRQSLASSLIIFSPEQKKYIKADKNKIFVANNTINFESLPMIVNSKEELKEKYYLQNKKIILCVGRMNTNNRKVTHLIKLSKLIDDNIKIIIIGPGINSDTKKIINKNSTIKYLGEIYDQAVLSEYYKLSDVFVMPGAIGLALNQAFYYGTPVVIENVEHGPEIFYFNNGENGFLYERDNVADLKKKISLLLGNRNLYLKFSQNARETILKKASIIKMFQGFVKAIKYVEG